MKQAVFFDIDGTIWDEKMQIPESTIAAVRALRANGNYAFLCSGRSRANIQDQRLLAIGFDGMVAACGTHIEFEGETVYESLLPQEMVAHALAVADRHHMHVVLEGPEYIYVNDDEFTEDPYVIYLRSVLGDRIRQIRGAGHYEVNKMSIDLNGASVEAVIHDFGEEFDVIVHGSWLIEVQPAGNSKATGIERLCRSIGIPREYTYAFGDSANDIEMLRFVEHGIAMGNATGEAKQAAEYVTAELFSHGIRDGLMHYGLI